MIIFSDLHLDVDSADVCLGHILPGILEATKQHKDKRVAFLGDFWHVRYRVVVRLQVAVRDELRRWGDAGVSLEIIPGNHDQVDIGGRNALEVFDDLPHVRVYTEPTETKDGLWIPYRKRQEDIAMPLRQWREKRNGPGVLFMHHGIRGAWMNDNRQNTEGLPLGMFGSDTVLCGHYHKRQQIPDRLIWYIGSPRQVSAKEVGQDKGYALWNGRRLEWVTTQWGPRYHQLEVAKGQALDLSGVRTGDDLRIDVEDDLECQRIARALDGLNVRHTVTPKVKSQAARISLDTTAQGISLEDYARSYVEINHGGLEATELWKLYEHLVAEAVQ
jgi:DNA repair exonuclease SbcCD nuclease subunit